YHSRYVTPCLFILYNAYSLRTNSIIHSLSELLLLLILSCGENEISAPAAKAFYSSLLIGKLCRLYFGDIYYFGNQCFMNLQKQFEFCQGIRIYYTVGNSGNLQNGFFQKFLWLLPVM